MARQVFDDKFTYEAPQLAEPLIYQHPYEVIADTIRNQGFAEATREDVVNSLPDAFNVPHLTQDDDKYNAIVNPWKERLEDISKAYVANDPNARNMLIQLQKEIKDSRTNGDLYKMGLRKTAAAGWAMNNQQLLNEDPAKFQERYDQMLNDVLSKDNDMEISIAGSKVVPLRPNIDVGAIAKSVQGKIMTYRKTPDGIEHKVMLSDPGTVGDEINGRIMETPGMYEYLIDEYGHPVDIMVKNGNGWIINPELKDKDKKTLGAAAYAIKEDLLKEALTFQTIKPGKDIEIPGEEDDDSDDNTNTSGQKTTSGAKYQSTTAPIESNYYVKCADRGIVVQNANVKKQNDIFGDIARTNISKAVDGVNISGTMKQLINKYPELQYLVSSSNKVNTKSIIKALDDIYARKGNLDFDILGQKVTKSEVDIYTGSSSFDSKSAIQDVKKAGSTNVFFIKGDKKSKGYDSFGEAMYAAIKNNTDWSLDATLSKVQNELLTSIDGQVTEAMVAAAAVVNFKKPFDGITDKENFLNQIAGHFSELPKNEVSSKFYTVLSSNDALLSDVDQANRIGRNVYCKRPTSEELHKMQNFSLDVLGGKFAVQMNDTWYIWNPSDKVTDAVLASVRNYYTENSYIHKMASKQFLYAQMFFNGASYNKVEKETITNPKTGKEENVMRGKSKKVVLDKDVFQKTTGINLQGAEPEDKDGKFIPGNYVYEFLETNDGTNQYILSYEDKKGNKVDMYDPKRGTKGKSITFQTQLELIGALQALANSGTLKAAAYDSIDSDAPNYGTNLYNILLQDVNKAKTENMNDFQRIIYDIDKARRDASTKGDAVKFANKVVGRDRAGMVEDNSRTFHTKSDPAVNFARIVNGLQNGVSYHCTLSNKNENVPCVIFKMVDHMGHTHTYLSWFDGTNTHTRKINGDGFNNISSTFNDIFGTSFDKFSILKQKK